MYLNQGVQNQTCIHVLHVWGGRFCLFVLWYFYVAVFWFSVLAAYTEMKICLL